MAHVARPTDRRVRSAAAPPTDQRRAAGRRCSTSCRPSAVAVTRRYRARVRGTSTLVSCAGARRPTRAPARWCRRRWPTAASRGRSRRGCRRCRSRPGGTVWLRRGRPAGTGPAPDPGRCSIGWRRRRRPRPPGSHRPACAVAVAPVSGTWRRPRTQGRVAGPGERGQGAAGQRVVEDLVADGDGEVAGIVVLVVHHQRGRPVRVAERDVHDLAVPAGRCRTRCWRCGPRPASRTATGDRSCSTRRWSLRCRRAAR